MHYYDNTHFKKQKKMINLKVVDNALKRSWTNELPTENKDSLTSVLVHDIFGGEILKTHRKNGWHFYNRIDGRRIDFTTPYKSNYSKKTDLKTFLQLLMRLITIWIRKIIHHF